jgi:regulator of PEP synthase PpsR (kinase-PPPase family)
MAKHSNKTVRDVFFVSDRTGITAETLGHSLLSQFEDVEFRRVTRPFIDSEDKARELAEEIDRVAQKNGVRPLVFSTLVTDVVRDALVRSHGIFFDFFGEFIAPLEVELHAHSTHKVGRSHGLTDHKQYNMRIDAVNFAMSGDDGSNPQTYSQADIILIGVSRSGKTPTCVYLALHYGVYAANYPLTEDDLDKERLPASLNPYRDRLYGLTIDPRRLQAIRSQRRPNSAYASARQCQREVRQVEALYRKEGIPHLTTTTMSIEEIAATILHERHLQRRA